MPLAAASLPMQWRHSMCTVWVHVWLGNNAAGPTLESLSQMGHQPCVQVGAWHVTTRPSQLLQPLVLQLRLASLSNDDEPLYQQFLASMQRQGPRSKGPRSRSATNKMPKANAQGQADAASVQGPGSEANAQGQADAARVQGPVSESNASGQADAQGSQASSAADPASWSSSVQRSNGPSAYKWETDTHEWVQRDCWACPDCGSMNLRFTQWCNCGKQREYQQEQREGNWIFVET